MTLDVVVPVYGQAELALACLRSVLAARASNRVEYRLIVVDDASPDPALRQILDSMAADEIILVRHHENRGFVGAANAGMLASDRDVILLNSDTEVYGDFADRLRTATYREPKTATATPFTNFGSIASYPTPSRLNSLPHGWTAAELDRLAQRVNADTTVEIPVGVGFCIYIRRECLDDVGLFDPAFGRGYGEEVDLCLRASERGWRHVLAPNVFVWHRGGASFGAERDKRLIESKKQIHSRWPSFNRNIRTFTARDPLLLARHRLTAARISEDPRPVTLRVSHAGSGGVSHHIRDLSAACEPWAESLELLPGSRGRLILRSTLTPAGLSLRTGRNPNMHRVRRLLASLGVARIHVHHLMGHGPVTEALIRGLDLPEDMTLHDYFFLAPQAHLVDRTGRFVGEPDDGTESERALLANSEVPWPGKRLSEWRARWTWLFERADRVIIQSHDCAARYQSYFPRPTLLTQPPLTPPHDAPVELRPLHDGPLRVLAIGALSKEKGADLLESVAKQASAECLPLEFHLVGYGYRELDRSVKTHGRYERDSLKSLVSDIDPHVAWYPVQWPETWLQTLTPALELGLPVVVTDIGAAPERVQGRPWTWIMPPDSSPSEACARLLDVREAMLKGRPPDPPRTTGPVAAVRSDFYPAGYLSPLIGAPRIQIPLRAEEWAMLAEWSPVPPPLAAQVARAGLIRLCRKLIRSRLSPVIRRLPPRHAEALARRMSGMSIDREGDP